MEPMIDVAHLDQQTFSDPELKREILTMFRLQAPALLAAMDAQSGAARGATAHRLKGSALAIGAGALAEAADLLEKTPASAQALQAVHLTCDKTMQVIAKLLQELLPE
jgi:HPt (histidine-containing phosphotransfer) domain-containing protein